MNSAISEQMATVDNTAQHTRDKVLRRYGAGAEPKGRIRNHQPILMLPGLRPSKWDSEGRGWNPRELAIILRELVGTGLKQARGKEPTGINTPTRKIL